MAVRFSQILIWVTLVSISTDTTNAARRGLSNPEFEGCIRGDTSGEPERGPRSRNRNVNQQHSPPGGAGGAPQPEKSKFCKEHEPEWQVHQKNLRYNPPQMDTGIDSLKKNSPTQLEEEIEHTDRKTLLEWYDYAYGLKELLNLVEEGAKKCGCSPLSKPILDTEKRINHALNAVSNKLRYGSVHRTEVLESDEEEEDE